MITLFATLLGTRFGVSWGITATNENVAKQDNQLAIHLLEKASEDTAYQSELLKGLVPILPKDSESLDIETVLSIGKELDDFENPEKNIPYPVSFDKIVNDYRVYSRLSYVGMRSIYRIQESLKQTKLYAEGENHRLREIRIADDDLLKEVFEPQDASQFIDTHIRAQSLVLYRKYLDVLSSILNIQVDYLKGEITESQADDLAYEIEKKVFLGDSERLDQDEIVQKMEEIAQDKEEIRRIMKMVKSEDSSVSLTQENVLKKIPENQKQHDRP